MAVGVAKSRGLVRPTGGRRSGRRVGQRQARGLKRATEKVEKRSRVEKPLLHRVNEGDPGAMQECIAKFAGLLWSLARRAGFGDAEAEDAVQEIFTELWKTGARFDPSIASDTAFVATIARRRLIDRRRRLGRQPTSQPMLADDGLPATIIQPRTELGEEALKAGQALEQLSPEQQRVLRLSVYEGLSHELIARSTGLPLGTVKTHARRGLMRLREMLAPSTNGALAREEGGK